MRKESTKDSFEPLSQLSHTLTRRAKTVHLSNIHYYASFSKIWEMERRWKKKTKERKSVWPESRSLLHKPELLRWLSKKQKEGGKSVERCHEMVLVLLHCCMKDTLTDHLLEIDDVKHHTDSGISMARIQQGFRPTWVKGSLFHVACYYSAWYIWLLAESWDISDLRFTSEWSTYRYKEPLIPQQ